METGNGGNGQIGFKERTVRKKSKDTVTKKKKRKVESTIKDRDIKDDGGKNGSLEEN